MSSEHCNSESVSRGLLHDYETSIFASSNVSPAAVPALPPVCQHHEGETRPQRHGDVWPHAHLQEGLHVNRTWAHLQLSTTGWPGCLVLKQGSVYQLFLGVSLMFLACLDHKWWAQFHLGILGPQE